jgi:DNA polymerase sigma
MSRPITIHEDDHSDRANMFRKAFEQAFNECWYCETNIGTSKRHGELICDNCNNREIRVILDPSKQSKMTEKELAFQLRIFLHMSEVGRKAKEDIR